MAKYTLNCLKCEHYGGCNDGEHCYYEAQDAAKARKEFENGELLIARNCSYKLSSMLNNNVQIVGGTGTGKSSTILEPNVRQMLGSMILSDPKGTLFKKYMKTLQEHGYSVHLVDFAHPEKGVHYNPLVNIRSTQDILKIASVIVNEKKSAGTRADPYWDSMTLLYLSALIAYMVETRYEPFNFKGILQLMREGTRNDEDDKASTLSQRFARLRAQSPESWACAQFDNVDAAPYKTYDTIRSTLAAKFAKFDTEEVRQMMSGNDIDFKDIGKRKTAVFVTVSDTDRSMDDLANLFFTQAMQALCDFADNECEGSRLPVPVRFILDDFATNCRIDEFPRIISTIRSRGISAMLMLQAESQLTQYYGEDGKTITANCDTYVYLGGNDVETAKAISERSNKPLSSILYMPVGSCWVFRRGEQPVFTDLLIPPEHSKEREH